MTLGKDYRAQGPLKNSAVDGVEIGGQKVKYVRGSDLYFAKSFGDVGRAIPTAQTELDGKWLYEGRIGVRDGQGTVLSVDDGRVYGPASIESIFAQAREELGEERVLCVVAHSKKTKVVESERKLRGSKRRRTVEETI